jgi:hypothetical protein
VADEHQDIAVTSPPHWRMWPDRRGSNPQSRLQRGAVWTYGSESSPGSAFSLFPSGNFARNQACTGS